MTDADLFFDALDENCGDEALWLVYADHLEERGDRRATVIRRCPVLLPPWRWLTGGGDEFVGELRRAVGPSHLLHGKTVLPLARRSDCDDVLYLVEETARPFIVVHHFTPKGCPQRMPHLPSLALYDDWDDWASRCMRPEHRDYMRDGEP